MIDECRRDVRYAARGLRRQPGFTLAATLTLALGIGLAIGFFAVVDAILLQPLPFADQDELVVLWEKDDTSDNPHIEVSLPNFEDWRAEAGSFVPGLWESHFSRWGTRRAVVTRLTDYAFGGAGAALLVLLGGVTLLLLIAGANVTGLMIVRSQSRRRDVAAQCALGIGRGTAAWCSRVNRGTGPTGHSVRRSPCSPFRPATSRRWGSSWQRAARSPTATPRTRPPRSWSANRWRDTSGRPAGSWAGA